MVNNSRIADLIRENEAEGISEAIEEGQFFDMQTFTRALIEHVLAGTVDQEVAANAATNRHDFMVTLERALKQKAADERRASEEAEDGAQTEPPAAPAAPTPTLRVAGR
jgi:Tfp pilus assembly ATPase PilU